MQFKARPNRIADVTAASFITGNEPGKPRQTGHTLVFGSAPNLLAQPQNNFVFVESSTCTSRPTMSSHSSGIDGS